MQQIEKFASILRGDQPLSSQIIAMETARLLSCVVREQVVDETVGELFHRVRQAGLELVRSRPRELTIGNTVRRVLFAIRQEHVGDRQTEETQVELAVSLEKLLADANHRMEFDQPTTRALRQDIQQSIGELIQEIEQVKISISENAKDHIHADEIILTQGFSSSVLDFLSDAAANRSFHVLVTENGPECTGHRMVSNLAKRQIRCTLLPDAATFAIMSRVNKVIVGTHGVLADGGVLAANGIANLAAAARHFSVPVLVLTGLYKVCPRYAFNQDTLNLHCSPNRLAKYARSGMPQTQITTPAFDYVPPEFVTLFLTNVGVFSPSYIYRLLAEYYHTSDYEI